MQAAVQGFIVDEAVGGDLLLMETMLHSFESERYHQITPPQVEYQHVEVTETEFGGVMSMDF